MSICREHIDPRASGLSVPPRMVALVPKRSGFRRQNQEVIAAARYISVTGNAEHAAGALPSLRFDPFIDRPRHAFQPSLLCAA